jgi:peptide/nickel transport system substrate-binding protein
VNGREEWGGDWGAMGWRDEALLADLQRIQQGVGAAAERSRVAQRLHDGLPVIPVAWHRLQVASSARLQGLRLDPLERSYFIPELSWARA